MTETTETPRCDRCRYWRLDASTPGIGACWQGNPVASKEHRQPPARTAANYACEAYEYSPSAAKRNQGT